MALRSCPNLHWLVIIYGLLIGVQDPGAGNFQRWLTVNSIPTSSGNESFNLKRRICSDIALMTALALFCSGLLCVNSGARSSRILIGLWGKLTGGQLLRQTLPLLLQLVSRPQMLLILFLSFANHSKLPSPLASASAGLWGLLRGRPLIPEGCKALLRLWLLHL